MPNHPTPDAFEEIASARLDLLSGLEWDGYYQAMASWLQGPNADIRSRALERLCMAVFSTEEYSATSATSANEAGVALEFALEKRLAWLLGEVTSAHARFDDVMAAFLVALQHHGHSDPYRQPLLTWLRQLQQATPLGAVHDMVRGTMLLVNGFDEDNADEVHRFVGLLDDPAGYVRTCAARQLSGIDSAHLSSAAAFALITEKEIDRPGIAGAFWSSWSWASEGGAPVDAVEWMMDILERRSGPEPADMPFTGIDFYLHELCDHSPDTIRRMIKGGYFELATETATETHGFVPGLEPVLRTLADHPDQRFHYRAQIHLALYYRVLHPNAADGAVAYMPDALDGCDTFRIHYGPDKTLLSTLVLYPKNPLARFDDTLAWALIDRLMPPDLRGELVNTPAGWNEDVPAAPWVMRNQVMRSYAAGPSVQLDGDVTAKIWDRIEISGGRLGKRWLPFGGHPPSTLPSDARKSQ